MLSDSPQSIRILVLEDELLLSAEVEAAVSLAGYETVGPAIDVDGALHLIRTQKIDAAILDLIVQNVHCDEVAAELAKRGIPFAIATGLSVKKGHPALLAAPRITKPFRAKHVRDVLAGLLASSN
ncbi:MAG: hypothetical protein ABIQ81_04430 [Novosphingobium sp.]